MRVAFKAVLSETISNALIRFISKPMKKRRRRREEERGVSEKNEMNYDCC
jgi:hypothetical protein